MKKTTYLLLLMGLLSVRAFAQKPLQSKVNALVDKEYAGLDALYKHLHSNPELSFFETASAARMAQEMRALGFEVTEKIGGNGVIGVLKNGNGPTILVRADMDALPIKEETGLSYASKVTTKDAEGKEVSVMHACGHDVHMSVLIGTAKVLAQLKNDWKGTIILLAQPAEERSGGAKNLIAEGLFTRFPRPDYCISLHTSASLPAGTVGYCPGYSMANVDMVDITIYGEGGHGAYPHTTKDPVVLAAQTILALQTVVSREVSPIDPAVLTVGAIHGGTKGNVIPNEVKLELTLRSYKPEVRDEMLKKMERICKGMAMAAGLPESKYPKIVVRDEFTPALYNDPALTQRLAAVFQEVLGAAQVQQVDPVMGAEDFGRYGTENPRIPICMYWLGTIPKEKIAESVQSGTPLPSLHSSMYAPLPEPSIKTGVKTMAAAVLDLLLKK